MYIHIFVSIHKLIILIFIFDIKSLNEFIIQLNINVFDLEINNLNKYTNLKILFSQFKH